MGYYDMSKEERKIFVQKMSEELIDDLNKDETIRILHYASDNDVYIRKNISLILGRTYRDQEGLRRDILHVGRLLLRNDQEKVRQSAVYLLGEIGKTDADVVFDCLETGLRDPHHQVRNSVMSALKTMGEKNPDPTMEFARRFLHDKDPEVRKKVIHGIELRGRTHPEDILPLLEEVQDEEDRNVRKMIIHVLGQISYKKGCLEKVAAALKTWHNPELIRDTLPYIIEVHKRYPFSVKTPEEAHEYLKKEFECHI